jgi:hypothetical protein
MELTTEPCIPAEHGPEALGYDNDLALAGRIADPN